MNIQISNMNRSQVEPVTAHYCASFFCRLRGLTFRRSLPDHWGLLLVQARDSRFDSAIHMLGVWTDLAVFWIDSDMRVVDKRLARSWRPAYIPKQPARYVLEMAPDYLSNYAIGDQLVFEELGPDRK